MTTYKATYYYRPQHCATIEIPAATIKAGDEVEAIKKAKAHAAPYLKGQGKTAKLALYIDIQAA